MNEDEIACPDCAETIKAAAKVCWFCGHRFVAAAIATPPVEVLASDESASFKASHCPDCSRPTTDGLEGCLACGANAKTGEIDGFAAPTVDGGGLMFLGGGFVVGFAALAVIATVAINKPASTSIQDAAAVEVVSPAPSAPPLAAPTYTAAQRSMICRAGIGKMMGRDPDTMNGKAQSNGLIRVQYRRPDDNKLWKSDCRIDGNRIIWRGVESFGNDGPGRWRDRAEDGALTFAFLNNVILITEAYSDGTSDAVAFNL